MHTFPLDNFEPRWECFRPTGISLAKAEAIRHLKAKKSARRCISSKATVNCHSPVFCLSVRLESKALNRAANSESAYQTRPDSSSGPTNLPNELSCRPAISQIALRRHQLFGWFNCLRLFMKLFGNKLANRVVARSDWSNGRV